MDGYLSLGPDDLTTIAGVNKLNNMFQALFNAMPGDGTTILNLSGYGSPNGTQTAGIGSTYSQIDGSGSTAYWTKQTGSGNTGWVAGASYPLSIANGGTGTSTGYPYIKVSEQQSSGTNGGTATSGSWISRVLNTKDSDTASIASLASNQVTLPAGTYIVNATSPFHATNVSQIRLQNITASTTLLLGTNTQTNTSTVSFSTIIGIITLASSSAVAIQYQVTGGGSANDLGQSGAFGTEIYTVADFIKVV